MQPSTSRASRTASRCSLASTPRLLPARSSCSPNTIYTDTVQLSHLFCGVSSEVEELQLPARGILVHLELTKLRGNTSVYSWTI